MFALLIAALLSSGASANPGRMYEVAVSEVRVGPIDAKGAPTGEVKPMFFEQRGTVGCRLERAPGKKPLQIWFKGTTDKMRKLRKLNDGPDSEMLPSRGGAPDDAAVCAFSAFSSSEHSLPELSNLQVLVTATFTRVR